jgi:lipopolysaccharide export system protein LptA
MYKKICILFSVVFVCNLANAQIKIEEKQKNEPVVFPHKIFDNTPPVRHETEKTPIQVAAPQKKNAKQQTMVRLENADTLAYNEALRPGAQLLNGDVIFSHDEVLLYCDSAYFYEQINSFVAFSNVVINQGDTLFVYGDVLYYDGNTKLARLRNNVLMDNLTATLTTDSLNFDRVKNVGYYFNGGSIQDTLNTLTSETGYYYPNTKTAVFRHNVVLTNPDFTMSSDTLHYNVNTKVASILGPTNIIYEEETHIYSEYGWYNTDNEQSKLLKNSYIQHNSGKKLIADTIFYDKQNGKGEGFTKVELIDTVKKVSLLGNYGYYIENHEIGLVTDSAVMLEYSSKDTLFLHADTLYTQAETLQIFPLDSLNQVDTLAAPKDSIYKIFRGCPNVRFYRTDLQGVCDSSLYSTLDSVLILTKKPIIWSDARQLSGDTIRIFPKHGNIDRVIITNSAFVCEFVEDKRFNQLSGKEIIGYIIEEKLRKVDVKGNAESIFYPQDEDDKSIILQAKTVSSIMNIYFKDDKTIERINVSPKPVGNMQPINLLADNMLFLNNYSWQISKKPISKYDIFRNSNAALLSESGIDTQTDEPKKKTTRRDDVKPIENETSKKNKNQTRSTDQNRPSGFDMPSFGGSGGASLPGGNSTLRQKN